VMVALLLIEDHYNSFSLELLIALIECRYGVRALGCHTFVGMACVDSNEVREVPSARDVILSAKDNM
jgi:hypothetical protein